MVSIDSIKNIVLFGAGSGHILSYFLEKYPQKIVGIIDNDKNKWGKIKNVVVDGKNISYEIKSPDYLKELPDDFKIIITTYKFIDEIGKQLNELGYNGRWMSALREIAEFNAYEFRLFEKKIDPNKPVLKQLCLEITNYCNCRCIYCPYHGVQNLKRGNRGAMDWKVIKAITESCKNIPSLEAVNASINGEIFMHPEWDLMIQYIVDNTQIKEVVLYTNGMLLSKKNIDKLLNIRAERVSLVVSIDGKSPEENDRYRIGDNYVRIKENIYALTRKRNKAKSNLEIVITNNYTLTEQEYKDNCKKEWPFRIETPEFLQRDFPQISSTSHRTFVYKSKYREDTFGDLKYEKLSWPDNYFNRCTNLYTDICVLWNGDIQICSCGAACMESPIGNVINDDILDVFIENPRFNEYRKLIFEGKEKPKMCDGCPYIGLGDYYVLLS